MPREPTLHGIPRWYNSYKRRFARVMSQTTAEFANFVLFYRRSPPAVFSYRKRVWAANNNEKNKYIQTGMVRRIIKKKNRKKLILPEHRCTGRRRRLDGKKTISISSNASSGSVIFHYPGKFEWDDKKNLIIDNNGTHRGAHRRRVPVVLQRK